MPLVPATKIDVTGVPGECHEMLAKMIANKKMTYEISYIPGYTNSPQSARGHYVRHSAESLTINQSHEAGEKPIPWSEIQGIYR